jgi:hypothetical protein
LLSVKNGDAKAGAASVASVAHSLPYKVNMPYQKAAVLSNP